MAGTHYSIISPSSIHPSIHPPIHHPASLNGWASSTSSLELASFAQRNVLSMIVWAEWPDQVPLLIYWCLTSFHSECVRGAARVTNLLHLTTRQLQRKPSLLTTSIQEHVLFILLCLLGPYPSFIYVWWARNVVVVSGLCLWLLFAHAKTVTHQECWHHRIYHRNSCGQPLQTFFDHLTFFFRYSHFAFARSAHQPTFSNTLWSGISAFLAVTRTTRHSSRVCIRKAEAKSKALSIDP